MLSLPLIRQDDNSHFSPMDKIVVGLDSMITALMMQGTINDPEASLEEVDTFRTLSVATIIPAEA
tara:strand:+ start:381 stop:575 length:195 start_codon:yes stop_codon:yes gene_type:complete